MPSYVANDLIYLSQTPQLVLEGADASLPPTTKIEKGECVNILEIFRSQGRANVLKLRAEDPPRIGWAAKVWVSIKDQHEDDLIDGRYNSCVFSGTRKANKTGIPEGGCC